MAEVLEFWPEYNRGPFWHDGESIALDTLPLSPGLRQRLEEWTSRHDDSRLPFADNDEAWLREGSGLLAEARGELVGYEVIVHEDWWGEPGLPFRQPGSA